MIRNGLLLLVMSLLVMVAPVLSLTVAQGDPVYMNETVDISLAVSYPTYQIAWCSANNYDCDPPDQIIDTENKILKKYWIDPSVFKYGTYYRWDGEWHRAENSVAFTVLPGKRPVKKPVTNITEVPNQIRSDPEGPFNYLVARGDTVILSTRLYRTDPCNLWLFTTTDETYNIPMTRTNESYIATLNDTQTFSLTTGDYSGYIQCDGNNTWQDITYIDGVLDTPYDDRLVPDVVVMQWNLLNTKRQFDDLAKSVPKFDDVLIPVSLEVSDPTTTITDVQQDENSLYISGVTTWSNGTAITLLLDPDQYPLERDRQFHTWQTFASGTIDAPRTFNTAIPFSRSELFIGTHEIVTKVEQKANTAVSSYTFKVSDVYIMPTPTPEAKRMIYGKDWEVIPKKIEPTPEPTANLTESWDGWVTITPEPVANATPTPNATGNATVTPTSVPTAEKTIPTIPLDPLVPIIAVAVILWRRL